MKAQKRILEATNLSDDEYSIHWDGDGELTLKGKMQHYILGIRNRFKYPNLLNYSHFNPEEIIIHTTDSRRVEESAYNHY